MRKIALFSCLAMMAFHAGGENEAAGGVAEAPAEAVNEAPAQEEVVESAEEITETNDDDESDED